MFALVSMTIINILIVSVTKTEEIGFMAHILIILPTFVAFYMLYKRRKFAPYVKKYNINYVLVVMFLPVFFYIIFALLARQGYFNNVERIAFSTGVLFFIGCIVLYKQIEFYIKRRKELKEKEQK
jgi:hypothetical protein